MTVPGVLPHVNGALNVVEVALLVAALTAIRSGRRDLHRRLMLAAVGVGVAFLAGYGLQSLLLEHRRFPGDDWVRAAFLAILGSHELLAVVTVPLVWRALFLARRSRFDEHRRWVRVAWPVWAYVAVTGVLIYWMNNFVRPR